MTHLVVISDIHAGSTVGLLPPGFRTHEGQEVIANAAQEYLWECWTEFWERVERITDGKYDLLVNGDLTEGCHHKSTQVISPDPSDHAAAALEILTPVASRARKTYIVEGTECHTHNMEHWIARSLDAVPDPATGRAAWARLNLRVGRSVVAASHHIGSTKRPYLESSAMGMDLNSERLEALRGGHLVPHVVIRSHRHRYGHFADESGMLLITPPWQLLTRFGHKVVPAASCHVGGAVLTFDETDDLPTVHRIIFTPQERVHANGS